MPIDAPDLPVKDNKKQMADENGQEIEMEKNSYARLELEDDM